MDTLEKAKNFFIVGLECIQNGDLGEAEKAFRESLQLVPNRPTTLNNLAIVLPISMLIT